MSGGNIPYHLRPQKAVDRRLFIDLLNRCERWRPLGNFAYISMGAYPLEDHKLIHRVLGIRRLIAFDSDENIVRRQQFNRPVDSCHCIQKKSGQLIEDLDKVLNQTGFSDADGLIVWLDYTSPRQLGSQIREFHALLGNLADGDIVRVTVNANVSSLGDAREPGGSHVPAPELRERRFLKLQERIGDFLPTASSASDMTAERLPKVLAEAFGQAAGRSLPVTGTIVFTPLSLVRYTDVHQMLSITGMVVERSEKHQMRTTLDLANWPFNSPDWKTVHELAVPDLTLRERLFLERSVATADHTDLGNQLGFELGDDFDMSAFLKNYKDFYRFYPTLLAAEL